MQGFHFSTTARATIKNDMPLQNYYPRKYKQAAIIISTCMRLVGDPYSDTVVPIKVIVRDERGGRVEGNMS